VSPITYAPPIVIDIGRTIPDLVLVEPDPIRVVIADAQPVVRAGFKTLLENEPDLRVAGTAAAREETLDLVVRLRPDVVLLDLDLPGGGLEAMRRIHDHPASSDVRVVMLAALDRDDDLFAALRAGAQGFLLKSSEPAELVQAVRAVADGDALLSPSATRRLIAEFAAQPQPQVPTAEQLDELTAREREVIGLVAAGLRNDEIAERFVISPATVKTHVSRSLRKLDARDRAQLVAIAYQLGIVRPGARRALRSVPPLRRPALVA
jgi:DNA-binding NarL/FixJ family response regulator